MSRTLEGVGVGLREGWGLAVPSEPIVDVVQVSAQEYGERHEAELQRKETRSEGSRGCQESSRTSAPRGKIQGVGPGAEKGPVSWPGLRLGRCGEGSR